MHTRKARRWAERFTRAPAELQCPNHVSKLWIPSLFQEMRMVIFLWPLEYVLGRPGRVLCATVPYILVLPMDSKYGCCAS